MLANPRFHGLDLPIYPDDTRVLITSKQVRDGARAAAQAGQETFVRAVDTISAGLLLKQCLEIADQEFDKVARLCGAKVVGHTWGLISIDALGDHRDDKVREPEDIFPDGYWLVAEVDTIVPVVLEAGQSMPKGKLNVVGAGVFEYEAMGYGQIGLGDMDYHQFMYGSPLKLLGEPYVVLDDIEPVLEVIGLPK